MGVCGCHQKRLGENAPVNEVPVDDTQIFTLLLKKALGASAGWTNGHERRRHIKRLRLFCGIWCGYGEGARLLR